jgi:aspartyl-tRNA(Asn)/glutamyl-tRNA(Gln) amidotransferase subunit A
MTIGEAGQLLRSRRISCLVLVDESLRANDRARELNAFITLTAEPARQEARRLDEELAAGQDRGPLHGIPIALKDLFYTAGVRTTNGSKLFSDFVPEYDATVVARLRDAGAVSIGKCNQHELAYGITSTNPHFGTVRNPCKLDCIPGGSSGGSGAAVGGGIVFTAMGSDTGGSIRIPAAYCGTVGLKPTFGRASRYGCFPLGLTLDHMGPLTRTVEDAAIVLNVIAGFDPRDESTSRRPPDDYVPAGNSLKGVRVGWPRNFYTEYVDDAVSRSVQQALARAERMGARVTEVEVPDVDALNTIARTILLCEASAVMEPHVHRRDQIGSDVLALLDQGRMLHATDYINAQRVRRRMESEWRKLFRTIDVLFTPSTPIPAPKIGQATVTIQGREEDTRLATTRFMRGINVLGLPALSVPCGVTDEGLPVSFQLIGRAFEEKLLLGAGAAVEKASSLS